MPDRTPAGSAFVVRASVRSGLRDANAIRAAALEEARGLRARAEAEGETIRQNARAQGIAEAAAVLASASATAKGFLTAREGELVELVFAIAHRLVADLPRDARTVALVHTALTEHGDASRLKLRAPPATAAALRAALSGVEVSDDVALGPDECVLLHPGGRTELGPIQQLRALMIGGASMERGR